MLSTLISEKWSRLQRLKQPKKVFFLRHQSTVDISLAIVWVLAAIALALRVYSLRFSPPPNEFLFWVPYIVMVASSAYFAFTKGNYLPIIFAMGTALMLHSIPALREPGNVASGIDQVHDLLIAKLGLSNGNFQFGNPLLHSHSYDQSFYPGLEFLTSAINLFGNISLSNLYNYLFVFVNLLTLVFFYFLMRRIVNNNIAVNVAVLLYALCPEFNSFDSATVHESLAIILFPLVLAFLLTNFKKESGTAFRKKMFFVAAISVFLIAITNEFSIYVLTFMSTVIVCAYLWVESTKKARAITRDDLYKISIAIICIVAMLGWLFFVASYYINLHSNLVSEVFLALTGNLKPSAQFVSPTTLPLIETILTYVGLGTLFVLSFIGAYLVIRRKASDLIKDASPAVLVVWWFFSLAMMVFFEIVPWSEIGEGPIRFRSMSFAYFGIVPMAAITLCVLVSLGRERIRRFRNWKFTKLSACVLLVVLVSIPTVYAGFNRYYYDNPPPVDMQNLNAVQAFYCSNWLGQFSHANIIAGTQDGAIWVSGVAAIPFSYDDFRTTIVNHTFVDSTYYVNLANVLIPDPNKMMMGQDNMTWLNSNLDTVYNNGAVEVLTVGGTQAAVSG